MDVVLRCSSSFLAVLGASAWLAAPVQAQVRRLNGPRPRQGAADVETDFALSADGTRVVFRSDLLRDEAFALFSARADAGGRTTPTRTPTR